MAANQNSGKAGEDYAVRRLKRMGYRILERNYRCRFGEIDMIAANRQYIVFVEVKTREQGSLVSPAEAVTPGKQQKLILTAQSYLACHPSNLQPRFDVAAVDTKNGKFVGWSYFENAFLT